MSELKENYCKYEPALLASKACFEKSDGDDTYMDYACYNAQMAVEFVLKDMLHKKGITPPSTHEVSRLIKVLRSAHVDLPEFSRILGMANIIEKWNTLGRYYTGVCTNVAALKSVWELVESLSKVDVTAVVEVRTPSTVFYEYCSKLGITDLDTERERLFKLYGSRDFTEVMKRVEEDLL